MKLEEIRRNVEATGIQETNRFSIEMNAASIDILSSKLYSNSYLAIVRELACNAWDAHIKAGNHKTPFEVWLPADLKSEFKIRDYGTGLSHDDVMYLYTTYFGSDKRNTNTQIGGFGLGSKTPYAYTSAFSVRSFFNGELREYAAYKNDEGIPTISLVSTVKTDELNGIEIAVPVKRGDTHKFVDVAQKALQWFPTPPKVYGHDLTAPVWETKLDTCGMLKNGERYGHASVVMGNVSYSLNLNTISGSHDLSRSISSMARSARFVLFAEIGELAITPSREELNYNEKTIARLAAMLKKANESLVEHVSKGIENEKTLSGKFFWRSKLPEEVRSMIQVTDTVAVPSELTVKMVRSDTWTHETGIKTTMCADMKLRGQHHPAILVLETKTAPFKKIIEASEVLHPPNKSNYRYGTRQADRDVYMVWKPAIDDPIEKKKAFSTFLANFDSQFVFWSSGFKIERAKPPKKAAPDYVKPTSRKRKLYSTKHIRTYSSKHNWNEIEEALDALDPAKSVLVGFKAQGPYNHGSEAKVDGGDYYSSTLLNLANHLYVEGVRFIGVPRNAWKTALKSGIPTIEKFVATQLPKAIAEIDRIKYIMTQHGHEISRKYPLLDKFVSQKGHLPEGSLAREICEKFDRIHTGYTSEKREKIKLIETYQNKRLFSIDSDNPADELMKDFSGAEEWLRYTYPELAEYLSTASWVRLDAMTKHYINCKEGKDDNER